jgi:hypothetical protein
MRNEELWDLHRPLGLVLGKFKLGTRALSNQKRFGRGKAGLLQQPFLGRHDIVKTLGDALGILFGGVVGLPFQIV